MKDNRLVTSTHVGTRLMEVVQRSETNDFQKVNIINRLENVLWLYIQNKERKKKKSLNA